MKCPFFSSHRVKREPGKGWSSFVLCWYQTPFMNVYTQSANTEDKDALVCGWNKVIYDIGYVADLFAWIVGDFVDDFCVSVCRSSPRLALWWCPPLLCTVLWMAHWNTGTLGHLHTGTLGHWDTGTLGQYLGGQGHTNAGSINHSVLRCILRCVVSRYFTHIWKNWFLFQELDFLGANFWVSWSLNFNFCLNPE